MANNRLYIVHTRTGDKKLLAKYYPSTGWYLHNHEALDKWLKAVHEVCPPDDMLFGDTSFELEYESQ